MKKLFVLLSFLIAMSVFAQPIRVPIGDDSVVAIYSSPKLVELTGCPQDKDSCIYSTIQLTRRDSTGQGYMPKYYEQDLLKIGGYRYRFAPLGTDEHLDTLIMKHGIRDGWKACQKCPALYFDRRIINAVGYYDGKIKVRSEYNFDPAYYDSYPYIFIWYNSLQKYTQQIDNNDSGKIIVVYNNSTDTITCDGISISIDTSSKIEMDVRKDFVSISTFKVFPLSTASIRCFFSTMAIPFDSFGRRYNAMIRLNIHATMVDSLYTLHDTIRFAMVPLNVVSVENVVKQSGRLRIFPNPSNGIINITCNLESASKAHLHIFNELGKDIMAVHDCMLSEGLHNFSFKLPQGMYYARMETTEGVVTKKIIVE